jgi:predicted TIM-barrel fold metal-dependent hydrolase
VYDGPIIDVDLHHRWSSEQALIDYLEPEWQSVVDRSVSSVHLEPPALFHHTRGSNKRVDAHHEDGPPGSSYAVTCAQWLDVYPVERAVLTFDIGSVSVIPNPFLASALCRAANDWSLDHWIEQPADQRLYGSLLVPTQIPADGVREIERMGPHGRIVEALMVGNGLGKPLGHPLYHPIYAAAAEHGLPIAIHNGGDLWNTGSQYLAAGMPGTRFEFHSAAPQSTMGHLASFITHGVFEKFPTLKLMIVEIGVAWVPWFLWKMDAQYATLRRESPWVKRLPSEYFREHVRLSTQPLEISPDKNQLIELLEAAGGLEDILVFASDYPHWDTDDPSYVERQLPRSWLSKVFYENGLKALRWPDDAVRLERPSSVVAA